MNDSLTITVVLYAAGLCGWAAAAALRGGRGRRALTGGLIVLELGLVVQALIGAAAMLAGRQPAEPATHAGYLIASVFVLPIAIGAGSGQPDAWRCAGAAIGCLAVLVVALRLPATWDGSP